MKNEFEPLVSVIILNYNAGNLLAECIESVLKTDYEKFEIIIVDNDSIDDDEDYCDKGKTGWTSSPSSDNDGDGCHDVEEDDNDDSQDEESSPPIPEEFMLDPEA